VASFFLVWILAGLAFHSQIIPLEYTVAQRWFYFTKIGLIGFLGAVFWAFAEYGFVKRFRNILLVTFCLIILAFSVRTFMRNFDFKDNLTLASRDLAGNPDSFELELIYGTEQLKLKNYEEARLHLLRSVDLNPYRLNVNNLATAYLGLGETDRALALFRKSAYEYSYYKSFENLASIYLLGGKLDESKTILDDAIAIFPNDPKLWYILSLYFEKVGQEKEAASATERYLLLKGKEE
jgi:tetratricopeptide (TPR) repeat protein